MLEFQCGEEEKLACVIMADLNEHVYDLENKK